MAGPCAYAFDDATRIPTAFARRGVLAGAAVSLFLAACHARPSKDEARATPEPPGDPAFVKLSEALTGHRDLDAVLGARISAAFGKLFPEMKTSFAALDALSKGNADPDELLDAATAAGLGDVALAVVAAWYTGTVGKGGNAIALAYAAALMNRPVADALAPPTYQLGGPAWWTAEPPPIGVTPPVERAPVPAPAKARAS
jgi:hypothetical protein